MKKIPMIVFAILVTGFAQQTSAQMMHPWDDDGWDHEHRHYMDWPDSAEIVEVTGHALVDSSFAPMPHYYIDTDNSGQADYILGFGPWWFEPESGAARPQPGQEITIKGWLQDRQYSNSGELSMVVVIEINGLIWREQDSAPPWSGNWLYPNRDSSQFVYCPTDSASWLEFQPGSMMGRGHGGGMMFPDSMFAQFELVHPDSLPGKVDSTCIVGFHINLVDYHWQDMMHTGRHGMDFRQSIRHRFHFTREMLQARGIVRFEHLELRYLDEYGLWQDAGAEIYDSQDHSMEYTADTVQEYYALFATGIPTSIDKESTTLSAFYLEQNYPNPFNPSWERTTGDRRLRPTIGTPIFPISGHSVASVLSAPSSASPFSS